MLSQVVVGCLVVIECLAIHCSRLQLLLSEPVQPGELIVVEYRHHRGVEYLSEGFTCRQLPAINRAYEELQGEKQVRSMLAPMNTKQYSLLTLL